LRQLCQPAAVRFLFVFNFKIHTLLTLFTDYTKLIIPFVQEVNTIELENLNSTPSPLLLKNK
jgi:hypothetical protein